MKSFFNITVILLIFLGMSGLIFQYGVNIGMVTIASIAGIGLDKCITTMDLLIKKGK